MTPRALSKADGRLTEGLSNEVNKYDFITKLDGAWSRRSRTEVVLEVASDGGIARPVEIANRLVNELRACAVARRRLWAAPVLTS